MEAYRMDTTSAPVAGRSRRELLFLAALVVLFTVLSVRYAHKVASDRSAFGRWRDQIRLMDEGVDISKQFNYPNPPVMAVVLEPFARLPPVAGALVWFYLKVAMALLSLYWVFRLVESEGVPFPNWAKLLTVLCSLKPIIDDLNHGNVNLFILFLVIAALTAYRLRRDLLAGVVLALAIACKVTPALFVPYFVWKRSWRALAGCAVGMVLFFYPGLVPGLRLGMVENQRQLASWYQGMVHPFLIEGKVTSEHVNQSLPGLLSRLGTHSPSFVAFPDNIETPTRYDNFLSLSPALAGWLVKGCLVLFALLVVWCCRTPADQRSGWPVAAEMAIVVLGMLLFSERTWKHHCVTLMLPFGVQLYYLSAICRSHRLGRGLTIATVAALVLMISTGFGLGSDRVAVGLAPGFAKMALVYGAYTLAFLVLLGSMAVVMRWGQPRRDGRAGEKTTASGEMSPRWAEVA
jgi:alpha-1,2-mannosyltransferase